MDESGFLGLAVGKQRAEGGMKGILGVEDFTSWAIETFLHGLETEQACSEALGRVQRCLSSFSCGYLIHSVNHLIPQPQRLQNGVNLCFTTG